MAINTLIGANLGTHRFQRAGVAGGELKSNWATCLDRTLEAMRTQASPDLCAGFIVSNGVESVPRGVASVTLIYSPLQEPRSLPLAVLIRSVISVCRTLICNPL
jgi:hypothetical protein